jgi:hypothetical protein
MNELRQTRFPRLRSSRPAQVLTPTIAQLLEQSGVGISSQAIVAMANLLQKELITGYEWLTAIDKIVGGVGLHNVNRHEKNGLTGTYNVEYRPLFRPIQYVFMYIFNGDLIWNARRIVQDSCLHLENAVKYRFHIWEGDRASLGILLNRQQIMKEIEPALLDLMLTLNRIVYRTAKHSVEDIRIDAHRFTPADAISIYFICRWAGVEILKPTGLFNYWDKSDHSL